MYHPRWPADVSKLEKAWAMEQAKERELDDVASFMDVGAEFSVPREAK